MIVLALQECDYDTDKESIEKAKKMLNKDLVDTLDFFITKEPLLLVSNVKLT